LDRIHYLKIAFAVFGMYIVWTTFKFTVLEHQYYRGLADKQQTITVKNPVSRGTIYSNNEPAGVFSTSTNLPDLAVDPQAPGDRKALIQFMTDMVYFEYCARERSLTNTCLDGVLSYIREPREDTQKYTTE
jgi:cell division protein FtsI/penicillin-binding protein 2